MMKKAINKSCFKDFNKILSLLDVQQANPSGRPTLKPVSTDEITNPKIIANGHVHLFRIGTTTVFTAPLIFQRFMI